MKRALSLLLFLCIQLTCAQKPQLPNLRLEGVRIWVDDLSAAKRFYTEILGFEADSRGTDPMSILIHTGSTPIYLSKAKLSSKAIYGQHIRTGLTLQVPKLLPAIDQLREAGIRVEETQLQRNGVGISIPFRDASGNLLSLMEVQIRPVAPFTGFKVYNSGITTSDMEKAIAFYEHKLGFKEWSGDYLPAALPLKHSDNSFAFMLHEKPGLERLELRYGVDSNLNLVFSISDLSLVKNHLNTLGIKVHPSISSDGLVFEDPFGNHCEVIRK
ncbi:MAG: VOC family protein [Roseivirga sp.]|nr:VOC family protein [Roseivirga sp.]